MFIDGILWTLALIGVYLLRYAVDMISGIIADRFQDRLRGHIEEKCYLKSQFIPLERLETQEYHDQLQRIKKGMEQRFFSTMTFIWRSFSNVVALVSLLLYLSSFHWLLPLILVIGTTPSVILHERVNRLRYKMTRKRTSDERRFAIYQGILSGRDSAAEVRLFNFGERLIDKANSLWSKLSEERLLLVRKETGIGAISSVVNAVTYIVSMSFSLGLLFTGQATIGAYAAFFYAIEQFQRHYRILVLDGSLIVNDLRYVRDYFDFIAKPTVNTSKGVTLTKPLEKGIHLDDVTYTYPGSTRPALSNITCSVQPGERVALVGENGAGKSTLVKILLGHLAPTNGRVLVDAVDLQHVNRDQWLQKFGVVFQDYNRYELTVRENIACGWIDHMGDNQKVEDAASKSGVEELVKPLSEGLDTPLGKTYREGTELSVGQWQKIAVARAYIRSAEILIFDEPTSALDAKAEAAVYEHFARISKQCTVLLISHRLGSCKMADRIVVLKEGRLIEQGSHKELMVKKGEYAEMYSKQAGLYS